MHYPYNPVEVNPPYASASVNMGIGNTDAALPVQNVVPVPAPPEGSRSPLVQTIEFEGTPQQPGGALMPIVTPEPPHFSVPSNPLLPDEYKEILSYETLQYMNGFLRTQIGKECMVMLVMGASGNVISRLGYLVGVGINYLLLQDPCSDELLICDFYSVRMVQLMGRRCPVNLNIQ